MRASPIDYSEELVDKIIERLTEGESLRSICRSADMPAISAVFRWLGNRPDFKERYIRAREVQADYMAELILDIADDGTNDYMERDGEEVFNSEHVQRSKLRVETRKWIMSKLHPERYADKVDHNVNQTTTVITRMEIIGVDPPPRDAKGYPLRIEPPRDEDE